MNVQKIQIEGLQLSVSQIAAVNIILELQAKFVDSLLGLHDFYEMLSYKTAAGVSLADYPEIIFGKSGSHIWVSIDEDNGEFTPARFIIITNR